MLQLATLSQSGTKATYDPLPGNEAGDEQLPLYNVVADPDQPRTDADEHASSAAPPSFDDIAYAAASAYSTDNTDARRPLSRTVIQASCIGLENLVWYTYRGLQFTVISTCTAIVVGGISTGIGLFFLHTLEPYKTVFVTDDRDGSTLALSVWAFLLGSGVCGATVGLLSLLVFAFLWYHRGIEGGVDRAKQETMIMLRCAFIAFALGPVAGVFADAVGVALAPASIRLPEQYTAMHAFGATFCGMLPFLTIGLIISVLKELD